MLLRFMCQETGKPNPLFWYFCRYWRYNEDSRTMDPGYPKPISIWKGIPDSPQGAFVDKANGMSAYLTVKPAVTVFQ